MTDFTIRFFEREDGEVEAAVIVGRVSHKVPGSFPSREVAREVALVTARRIIKGE